MAQGSGQDQTGSSCLLCSHALFLRVSHKQHLVRVGPGPFLLSPPISTEKYVGASLLVQAEVEDRMIIPSKSSLQVVLVNSRASLEAS